MTSCLLATALALVVGLGLAVVFVRAIVLTAIGLWALWEEE